jgi:hypothetical protein
MQEAVKSSLSLRNIDLNLGPLAVRLMLDWTMALAAGNPDPKSLPN